MMNSFKQCVLKKVKRFEMLQEHETKGPMIILPNIVLYLIESLSSLSG